MAKPTKASKAAEAILKLDASALDAQERITKAAEKAQKLIDEACATATAALEQSSRVPDKRNLNGSFQWDRGDRYRRGSDDRMQRIEDKINGEKTLIGSLEVGQAKRDEQIIGVRAEIKGLQGELDTKKIEIEHLANELTGSIKELSGHFTTQGALIRGIKEEVDDKLDAQRDEMRADKIKNQQYVIGIVVGLIVTFVMSVVFGYLRV